VDEIILVDTDEVCAAIKDVFQDTRSILEPAGALAIAGAKLYAAREKLKDKTLVTVLSGANMNFDRLHFVAERAEIASSANRYWPSPFPKHRAASANSVPCWVAAISPSSTIVMPIQKPPRYLSAYRYATCGNRQAYRQPEKEQAARTGSDRQRNGQAAPAPSGGRRAPK